MPQALEVDPVADLIARVEKEYQAGQDNYRAGHLEAAKQNFDSAFNQLLGSGFDLHSDDRLEPELDRILDGINGLELAALQQGDGFAEQKSEPAPIDEANELTPAVDQNVKAKAEAEIKSTRSDLPLMMTDQVAGYINYFSNRGRGTVEGALARSGRYEDMIRRILREEGVPQELIYLAQAESGFHPLAVSRAGARGMWQFMGSRAKGYGLERSWWVDDRQDPEKATRAAAHHLKDLYNQFGDWYLAMAAYNSGPGTVQSAVKRTGYADFWELYRRNVLPKETRNYVPIIVAVTIMAKNPAQYGLDSVVKEKPVPYDTVKINYPIDLRLAAECVDATAEDLLDLNPSLLRLTTPKFSEKTVNSTSTCQPEPPPNFKPRSPPFQPTSASGGAITKCKAEKRWPRSPAPITRLQEPSPKRMTLRGSERWSKSARSRPKLVSSSRSPPANRSIPAPTRTPPRTTKYAKAIRSSRSLRISASPPGCFASGTT